MSLRCETRRHPFQSVIGHGLRLLFGAALSCLPVAFAATPARPASPPATRTLLVMGDSLSAAHGLDAAQGWVALTAARLSKSHPRWRVVNASVSGETTSGGAARIDRELARTRPALVIIELGANDGLRGLPAAQTRANLGRMIVAAQRAGAKVLLVGMRLPPNYGREYTTAFADTFASLARQYRVALLPFLLEPIAFDRGAYLADNLHPNAGAQPRLRDHVWPALLPLLRD